MASEEISTAAVASGTRPPRILQVLPELVTGGVERGAIDVGAAIARAGWSSTIVSAGGPMVRFAERAGVRHIAMPVDSKNPFTMHTNMIALSQLIEREDVDIVHARSRAPAWSAYYAAKRTGRTFMTTYHGTYSGWRNPIKRRYNEVMAKGERVIAISHFIAGHLREVYGIEAPRVVTIPRGIDTRVFDPMAVSAERMIKLAQAWRIPDGAPVVMLPGRLTRWKGQRVLIEAIARLGIKDIRCLLVGDDQGRGGFRAELEALAIARGLQGVVHITGPASDMAAAYMLSDVVVSASTDPEAFGRVSVEGQAMGRPVVATDHGGSRETVRVGETGWLVPPNDPAALAEAIKQALALGSEERARRAAIARRHVLDNYTVERMCEATLGVYADLLTGAR